LANCYKNSLQRSSGQTFLKDSNTVVRYQIIHIQAVTSLCLPVTPLCVKHWVVRSVTFNIFWYISCMLALQPHCFWLEWPWTLRNDEPCSETMLALALIDDATDFDSKLQLTANCSKVVLATKYKLCWYNLWSRNCYHLIFKCNIEQISTACAYNRLTEEIGTNQTPVTLCSW